MEQFNKPFIKITWEDNPENFTQERIRRVKSYFQKKYNTRSIRVETKPLSNGDDITLESLDVSDNIYDPQYQKKLMKDFIEQNKIEVDWNLLDKLDNKVNSEIDDLNKNLIKFNKWYIKKISCSNFLSFGDGNIIDFDELGGITVIESEPKNFGGKSTLAVDLLLFLFFNKTTKTKTNIEVFNKFRDVNELSVKGEIIIDGEEYIIERSLNRKQSKSGEWKVTSLLDFSKIDEEGTLINLKGEQRRETEKFIASAIGTEEDFLSTIVTTGSNMEQLIDSKPTARGQTLTKFMGLDFLRDKEEIAKRMYNDWSRKLVSNTYNLTDLKNEIETSKESIDESTKLIKEYEMEITTLNSMISKAETEKDNALSSINKDIDQELINTNPSLLSKEIEDAKKDKNEAERIFKSIDVKEPSSYYNEDDHNILLEKITDLRLKFKSNDQDISRYESQIKELQEGTICPTCKRPLEDVDHSKEINELNNKVINLKKENETIKEDGVLLKEKEEEFKKLKEEFYTYEKEKLRKSKYELDVERKTTILESKELKLERYESNKNKLEENKKYESQVISLKTKIQTLNSEVLVAQNNIEKHRSNILMMDEKIKINSELVEKITGEEKYKHIFTTYLLIFGKNGISKVIMKNMIPLLNNELYRLLSDTCEFILELNVNDKNEVEFIMIDTETRVLKSLVSGSGYEKTVSSLALRSVLTKISSLPKPNIIVMDEVFGKVADENLELVGQFFIKVKEYFEHVILISHNQLVRNWSDNLILVEKDENVSKISEIVTIN